MSCPPMRDGKELSAEEWENVYWKNNNEDPPFHNCSVHSSVSKFYNQLFGEGERGRVMVPLCGKSIDMVFFADKGHEVVGVEFSQLAVESFFKENNLTYTERKTEDGKFVVYRANEKNITIYKGDFFSVNKDMLGEFDAFWDRGSFEAINLNQREEYLALVAPMMKRNSKYLLSCLTYDATRFVGPPHDVTRDYMEKSFGRYCTITLLQSLTMEVPPALKEYLDEWTAHDYLLKRKP